MKKAVALFMMIGLLTLHAHPAYAFEMKSKKIMWEQAEVVETALRQQNWPAAKAGVYELKRLFDKHKWKMQLMGDEAEIEGLQQAINQLIASIENQDDKEGNLEIADIKTYLQNIYDL